MINFHENYFNQSILFENVNPSHKRQKNTKFRNIHSIENKLTRFQIFQKAEIACKYKNALDKTQYFEILVQ